MTSKDDVEIQPIARFPAMIDSWDEVWCEAEVADFFRVIICGEVLGDFPTYGEAMRAIWDLETQGDGK